MVRVKHRYFLFEVNIENEDSVLHDDRRGINIDQKTIMKHIHKSVNTNFGPIGFSKVNSNLRLFYYNPKTRVGLLRTYREHFNMVWSALTLINNINQVDCCITILKISATIKKVQHGAIKHDRELLLVIHKFKYQELIEEEPAMEG